MKIASIFYGNFTFVAIAIPINKSVTTLLLIETQTQYVFLNQEVATPFLDLV